MSTVKANNVQVGQSGTASQNFTLYQPSTPDGTVRLAVGNSGATTGDVLSVSSTGLSVTGTLTSTGVNTFPAGSASAPSITTTGDTNTGVFFPAADTAAITTGGSERMRVTSGGNLLVGTTSTSLAGATTGSGLQYIPNNAVIVAANGGNSCLIANKTDSTTGSTAIFRYNGSTVGDISITSTNAAYNTASSSTNGAQLNYQGITFPATQSASSDANTLDDYEEGTWTPAYVFSTSGSVTYNAGGQTGKYTKIGNLVTVKCLLSVATTSSPTGNVTISGLPFTPLNNDDGAGGSIGSIRDFSTITQLRVRTNINYTSIYTETNAPNASISALQGSNLANGCRLEFSVTYMTA